MVLLSSPCFFDFAFIIFEKLLILFILKIVLKLYFKCWLLASTLVFLLYLIILFGYE